MPGIRLSRARTHALAVALSLLAARCSTADADPPRRGGAGEPAGDRVRRGRARTPRELPRFESAAAFRAYADELARRARRRARSAAGTATAAPAEAAGESADSTAAGADGSESITNTQEAGVDEGGIVKTHGEHLVVLRRGRLFSIDVSDGQRRPISRIDLAPAARHDAGVWYDEMLVWRDTIVVIGYSYASGGTELVLFDIDAAGHIRPRGRHHLRSNDYYSSRNYASRLLGSQLIFYMPYAPFEQVWEGDHARARTTLPALRDASGVTPGDWREIVRETDIHRPIQETDYPVLHTVVTCDLAAPSLRCQGRGILGPYGRTFYVSSRAVYVWVHGGPEVPAATGQNAATPPAVVYRLPLDGGAIGAVRVTGAPTDQLSFREGAEELDVLVRSEGGGDWMWGAEVAQGDVALARLPLAWFSEGVYTAPRAAYTPLPRPSGGSLQNRFVGEHVLYGTGGGWYGPGEGAERRIHVYGLRSGRAATLELDHGVDRIEAMGHDAVAVGSDGRNLVFSSIGLVDRPERLGRYVQEGATQGETRTHGFFYRPESDTRGVLGLPVRRGDAAGWEQLTESSASVLFLRVDRGAFARAGQLASRPGAGTADACRVSCVDWYGNARPIFFRGRVFALLGYELVEGRLEGAAITELGRTSFLHPEPR